MGIFVEIELYTILIKDALVEENVLQNCNDGLLNIGLQWIGNEKRNIPVQGRP